jgi:catechol 2,3-dioxygenase-like lactoylglutathione lyase family enzyme
MSEDHHVAAIVPAKDIDASEAFYRRLGFETVGDYGDYRLMEDGRGWYLHLRLTPDWPSRVEDNPMGLYLYVDDVDAVAERVRELIIEPQGPHDRPWGTYEFSVSDPSGALIRIGRALD